MIRAPELRKNISQVLCLPTQTVGTDWEGQVSHSLEHWIQEEGEGALGRTGVGAAAQLRQSGPPYLQK